MIDIEIQEIPTKGHALEPYIYKLVHDCGYSKVAATERKRELEQAQKVVYNTMKLIQEIEDMYSNNTTWSKTEILEELHKVLRDDMR